MTTGTTPQGVSQASAAPASDDFNVTTESDFQSLFDNGAFDVEKPELEGQQGEQQADEQTQGDEGQQGDEGEQGDEPPAAATKKKDGDVEYDSLEDFLTKSNLDADAFRSLPVTVKIDGETKSVPLADVLKSYQLEGHVNNKSIALSEQQKAFEAERAQAANYLRAQVQTAQNLGQMAQQQLLAEYQSINWDALKGVDPGVWTQKMIEFQQRQGQINQHLQQVEQLQAQETQRTEQERLAQLPKEREILIGKKPEWADSQQYKSDQTAMSSYAKTLGFSDAELGNVFDHRFMMVLHDAARYAALQAAKPEAVKKVRAAPQMAKPGVRVNRSPAQSQALAARQRFNDNPRDEDAQAAWFEHLA